MNMARSGEHSEGPQFAKEGDSSTKDQCSSLEVGCEDWFGEVVGLQN